MMLHAVLRHSCTVHRGVVDALPSTVPWPRSESLVVQSLIELPAAAGHDARTELLRFHQEMCAFLSSGSTHSRDRRAAQPTDQS